MIMKIFIIFLIISNSLCVFPSHLLSSRIIRRFKETYNLMALDIIERLQTGQLVVGSANDKVQEQLGKLKAECQIIIKTKILSEDAFLEILNNLPAEILCIMNAFIKSVGLNFKRSKKMCSDFTDFNNIKIFELETDREDLDIAGILEELDHNDL